MIKTKQDLKYYLQQDALAEVRHGGSGGVKIG